MSLSKKIIYGTDQELASFLRSGVELNVVDEYGYTPLIQTAIVDSVKKAKLLLTAGAEVDFPDLTNRTALHWAASNNNLELCELLLVNGANANAYTTGGQSVLVTPLLRKHKKITELLYKYGANLDFAEDFINAKLLGHRYELEGRVDIVDTGGQFIEVELEGFYLEFSLEVVTNSLLDFRNNYGGKHLQKYFYKVDAMIKSLQIARELLRYQHYLTDVEKHRKKIEKLLNYAPLVLPISFEGHAITLVKYWDWLVRCDRGEFGRKHGTVILYYMRNVHAVTKDFMQQMLYKRQYAESINISLAEYLDMEAIWKLPLTEQRAGNCSWANVEAAVPAMMFLLLLEETNGKNAEKCEREAMHFYQEWLEWDKERALQFCMQSAEQASPARKAAKAALLAAILFQACDYNNARDRDKMRRMLPILTLPEYKYILRSYLEVFTQDAKNERVKNFYNFLDDFGLLSALDY